MSDAEWDPYNRDCPSRTLLDRVSNRWSILVIGTLASGPRRFNEIAAAVDGVSQKMLAQTLRGLEHDGLVTRTVTAQVPVRVDYALTEAGQSLREPLAALEGWVRTHMSDVEAARRETAGVA